MKIAVLTSRYPIEKEPYNHMFVHIRNREYLRKGENVEVFIPSKENYSYTFEGIRVTASPVKDIIKKLEKFDVVFIHLLHPSLIPEIDGSYIYEYLLKYRIPTLFFIHGIEVQKIWVSRREDIELSKPKSIIRFLYHDFFKIPKMKNFINRFLSEHPYSRFIAVSEWMLRNVHTNMGIDISPKSVIIPNGVDTKLFKFKDRWNKRYNVLTIRPLILKGKYAVDLAINTFKYIKTSQISLSIYGRGRDAAIIRQMIKNSSFRSKIILNEVFIQNREIPKIHDLHGIYYAVTRMDAQGVSMCEAMASGLPVVSFNICGIPEFIKHMETGILVRPYNLKEAAEWIETLVEDKNLYIKLSENARKFIEQIDIKETTQKELEVAQKLTFNDYMEGNTYEK